MRIKNKSIHLITLVSGTVIKSFETVDAVITPEEIEKYSEFIEVDSDKLSPTKTKPVEKAKVAAENILNSVIINDYTERRTATVLNSIDEDHDKFTNADLDLFINYESTHKNRHLVLDKLKEIKNKRGE